MVKQRVGAKTNINTIFDNSAIIVSTISPHPRKKFLTISMKIINIIPKQITTINTLLQYSNFGLCAYVNPKRNVTIPEKIIIKNEKKLINLACFLTKKFNCKLSFIPWHLAARALKPALAPKAKAPQIPIYPQPIPIADT